MKGYTNISRESDLHIKKYQNEKKFKKEKIEETYIHKGKYQIISD